MWKEKEMKELNLINCNNTFYKKDKNKKFSIYFDPINNNMILFAPFDDCTIESVCDATVSEGAYEYLIEQFNNTKNMIVLWSEIYGTTSDYVIYYDFDVKQLVGKSWKEIVNMLPEGEVIAYKFVEVKNGVSRKLLERK